MKTYFTIFSFLIFSMMGIQNSFAQKQEKAASSNTIKEMSSAERAKQEVYNMGQSLGLTAEQQKELQILFVELDEKRQSIKENEKTPESRKMGLVKVNEAKTERLKQILTEDQYNQYLKML
jgi:hypothetical protein